MNRGSTNISEIRSRALIASLLVMLILVGVLFTGCKADNKDKENGAKIGAACQKEDTQTKDDHMTFSYESAIENAVEMGELYDYPATAEALNADNCKGVYVDDMGFLLEFTEDGYIVDAYGAAYRINFYMDSGVYVYGYDYKTRWTTCDGYQIPAAIEPDGTLYFGTLVAHRVDSDVTSEFDKNLHDALAGSQLVMESDAGIFKFHTDDTYHVSALTKVADEDYDWKISGGTLELKDASYRIRRLNEVEYVLSTPRYANLCFCVEGEIDSEYTRIEFNQPSNMVLVPDYVTGEDQQFVKIDKDGTLYAYDLSTRSYSPMDCQLDFELVWKSVDGIQYVPERVITPVNGPQFAYSIYPDNLILEKRNEEYKEVSKLYSEDSIMGQLQMYEFYFTSDTTTKVDADHRMPIEISSSEYYTGYPIYNKVNPTLEYANNDVTWIKYAAWIKMPDGYGFYPKSSAYNTMFGDAADTKNFYDVLNEDGVFVITANEDQPKYYGEHKEIYPAYYMTGSPTRDATLIETFDNGVNYYEYSIAQIKDYNQVILEYKIDDQTYLRIYFDYTFPADPMNEDVTTVYEERDQIIDFYRNVKDPFVIYDSNLYEPEIVD